MCSAEMLVNICLLNIFVCYIVTEILLTSLIIVVMSSDVKVKIHTQNRQQKIFILLIEGWKLLTLQLFLRAIAATAFSASQPSQFCLSVCLSVTRVDQSKTVQARITKSSPSAA